MRLMLTFFRAYPGQTLVMLLALIMAGLAEGMGLSALLPLLNIAIGQSDGTPGTREPQNDFERAVVETLEGFGITPGIGVLLLIIVIGITLKSLLLLVARKRVGYTAAQVATDLRLEMLRAILLSKWEFFLHQRVGRLSNSLATEAQRSSDAFVNGATVITMLLQALIYGGIALAVSWKATLIGLSAGTVLIAISHFLVRMARRAGKRQTTLQIALMSRLTDTLQSVKPLKAMAREHLARNVLSDTTTQLNKALKKQIFSAAVLDAAQEEMFAILIALGMYIALVNYGMPFQTVLVLAVVLGRMLSQLGKVQKQYQKMVIAESAFWSLKDAIRQARTAEEHLGRGATPTLDQGVRFDAVDFSYEHHPVFENASLEIPAGSLTTLVGPSGSGKTTVIDLVIGLLRPQAGAVRIDGRPLAELDLKTWRRMIGYVPQETLLLHDSVLHNVTLGDPELSEDDAVQALQAAGAWEFVEHLPDGIHSTVGERGGKLSGGQRQRIMIARALVHKPRLLILDEATSALDPANEAAIGQTVRELRGGLTILAISHQTALVEAADRVYRLEKGGAVEQTG
jgi:ATP-binding cassette subfamily C protein